MKINIKSPLLHLAVVELTKNCNLRCKHCYGNFVAPQNMSIDDFKIVCENLQSVGVSIITLSGGEPMMLLDNIKLFIDHAKGIFQEVRMTSNGTMINENNIKNLINLNSIQLSIDGNESTHDQIRGKGNYARTLKALTLLKGVLPTSIMMTLHNDNFHDFKDVIVFAQKNNLSIGFERITNVGNGKQFCNLSNENFIKVSEIALKYKIESSDPIISSLNENRNNYLFDNHIQGGCSAGYIAITIDADLNVYPCARLRIKVGNLKLDKLFELLNNSPIIANLCDRSKLKGACGVCIKNRICGGCRASAFSATGDYLEADPQCIIK